MSLQISIDLKELYKRLCKKCRREMLALAKESLTDRMVKQAFGIEEKSDSEE
jgi:hypothetical protein